MIQTRANGGLEPGTLWPYGVPAWMAARSPYAEDEEYRVKLYMESHPEQQNHEKGTIWPDGEYPGYPGSFPQGLEALTQETVKDVGREFNIPAVYWMPDSGNPSTVRFCGPSVRITSLDHLPGESPVKKIPGFSCVGYVIEDKDGCWYGDKLVMLEALPGPLERMRDDEKYHLRAFSKINGVEITENFAKDYDCHIIDGVIIPREGAFYNVKTGDLYFINAENKSQVNKHELYNTFQKIRDFINTNVKEDHTLTITLTYAPDNIVWKENGVQEEEQPYKDFHNFWLRFKRYCKNRAIEKPEYISIIEPQARGAWHFHVLLFFENDLPWIDNADIANLWRQGFTKTQKLFSGCTNYGAYFTAYLTDVPLDDIVQNGLEKEVDGLEVEERESPIDKSKKKYIKGGRIWMYPRGMRLFRYSRGIKKPLVVPMTRGEALEKVSAHAEQFVKYGEIKDKNGTLINTYQKSFHLEFSKRAEKSQENV